MEEKNIIELARELGKAIQEDERCITYNAALEAVNNDSTLQDLIKEFNLKKMAFQYAVQKDTGEEKLKPLENEVNEIYSKIQNSQLMMAYDKAKKEMNELMGAVNYIISRSVAGEDPDTVDPSKIMDCMGNCNSCGGGCH